MEKRLYRNQQHKVISGVCAGLADYLNIDVVIIRIIFLLTFLLKGGGGLIYIILWIALPKGPYRTVTPGVDYVVPPGGSTTDYGAAYPRKSSGGRTIGGMILILIGVLLLLDEFDLIPDVDYEYFWPTALIVVGLIFIFTSKHKTPAAQQNPFDNNSPKL